jgi:membrane-associated phospholipid phosphatase
MWPEGYEAMCAHERPFAAATAVAILCPRLRLAALPIAAAAALSRVYLRVHSPLDVGAGALIGAGLGALCAIAALRLRQLAPHRVRREA